MPEDGDSHMSYCNDCRQTTTHVYHVKHFQEEGFVLPKNHENFSKGFWMCLGCGRKIVV